MIYKTKGIVLSYIKYRESSIIVKIYTELFGLQTYIVNGIRSAKSRQRIALYQPLTQLDMVVYHKHGKDINRISEYKCAAYYASIPYDITKSSLAIFLTEILIKALKEESEDRNLFSFITDSLLILDHLDQNFESFHIQFMCKLTKYLGFSIESAEEVFGQVHLHMNHQELAQFEKGLLDQLIRVNYQQAPTTNGAVRRDLVEILIKFYKLHIASFGEVKSLSVLAEVLH